MNKRKSWHEMKLEIASADKPGTNGANGDAIQAKQIIRPRSNGC